MTGASRRAVVEYEILYPVVMMECESCLFLEATKSFNGTEKSIPPKRHFQEVPRTSVQVSRRGGSACETLRYPISFDRATPRRDYQSLELSSDLDGADKNRAIGHTGWYRSGTWIRRVRPGVLPCFHLVLRADVWGRVTVTHHAFREPKKLVAVERANRRFGDFSFEARRW